MKTERNGLIPSIQPINPIRRIEITHGNLEVIILGPVFNETVSDGTLALTLAMKSLISFNYTDIEIYDTIQALEAPQAFSNLNGLYITM